MFGPWTSKITTLHDPTILKEQSHKILLYSKTGWQPDFCNHSL